ncbi:MAG: hypothetical protein JRG91_21005, partial [Deltaproteobacteria bacterium]|nr:hypothetical protein [Deltaproteobacteria bacterium]
GVDDDCDGPVDEHYIPTFTCGDGVCERDSVCSGGAVTCTAGFPTGPDTTCNGVDEDCDGSVDEHWVAGTCGVGACMGTATCVGGTESCIEGSPTADTTCDGIDDDCDGSTDEHWVAGTCGVGACMATETCVSGVESCTPGAATIDNDCDGIDDDCDGSTDEHWVAYTCGSGSCTATATCIGGVEDCTPGSGAVDDTCDGVDDDCDGSFDEHWTTYTCGVGACLAWATCVAGTESCVEGPASLDNDCDGIDDDCDGSVDEHWVAGTCGVGACLATETCIAGVESCTPGAATIDNDCDGVDDDCDGSADEHWIPYTCGVGACLAWATCVAGAESCISPAPTSDANCNGIDNDCDGETDEHYVPYTCGSCPDLSECISGTASCSADTWCNDTGHATLIGHDYFASNADADRIMGNAVFLTTATGTVQVLGYTQYADTSSTGEVANTNAAIDARAAALGRTWRLETFTDYTQLDSLLPGYHVLLVYEQESGNTTLMQTVGTAWSATLDAFVNAGGVVIVADYSGGSWEIMNSSGLMTITSATMIGSGSSLTLAAPGDAVASGVSNPYTATNGTITYTTSDTVVVSQTSAAVPVVVHKEFTTGGCHTYSELIPSGTLLSSSPQCTGWNTWRFDTTGRTCTDPTIVQAMADALRTAGTGSWSCDGNTWTVGPCGSGTAIAANAGVCSCLTPDYVARPCINNLNWGGVNTASCSSPTQTLTVDFCGSGGSTGCDDYTENFPTGTLLSSSPQCTNWNSWRAGLATSGIASINARGTYDTTGVTCSVPAMAQAIADALRTDGTGSWVCDGHTWYVGVCGGTALSIDMTVCTCTTGAYSVRPCINNANWGGITTATCSGPTQDMTVEVCGAGSTWAGLRTFTNCSATGSSGPTQAGCDTEYTGLTLDGEVTVTGGIQAWTVPMSGTFRIEAYGAEGHSAETLYSGGDGAMVGGDFVLTAGEILYIVVGQQGVGDGCNGGGGGGTFVVDASDTAMIVAGGGAGTRSVVSQDGCDGRTSDYAGTGSGSGSTHTCPAKTSGLTLGGIVSSSSWGSGAGGFVGNGTADGTSTRAGISYLNGATGGYDATTPAYGGFGGGGAGEGGCGGGGGGGYSGGDGGRLAGGGGSYNSGGSPTATAGANTGHGYATIDLL